MAAHPEGEATFDPTPSTDTEANAAAYAVHAERTIHAPRAAALASLTARERALAEAAFAAGVAAVSDRVLGAIGTAAETVRADTLLAHCNVLRAPDFRKRHPLNGSLRMPVDVGAAEIAARALKRATETDVYS